MQQIKAQVSIKISMYNKIWCIWKPAEMQVFHLCGTHDGVLTNILATLNHESGNLEIRVPVLRNRIFCAWLRVHFYRNISQGIAASAVRSSLYEYSYRNYHSVCAKVNLKSDFHITGQLMETHPEYSPTSPGSTFPTKYHMTLLPFQLYPYIIIFTKADSLKESEYHQSTVK